jgi:biotin carboxylase
MGKFTRKVLLLCGTEGLSLQILYCLKKAGCTVHGVGSGKSALRHSRLIERYYVLPLQLAEENPDAFVNGINTLHDSERFDYIVPGSGVNVLCALKERISIPSFPVPSLETYHCLNDKWNFYNLCLRIGVPTPKTMRFDDKNALRQKYKDVGQKIVVKPTAEGFMNGIVFANGVTDLQTPIFDNPDYRFRPLLLQEFIDGVDIDISILALNGEIKKAAVQMWNDKTVEFIKNTELVALTEKLVDATNYSGVAHFDARIAKADGSLYLLECNPRFWGSINAALFCGVNFVAEGLCIASGADVSADTILPGMKYAGPLCSLSRIARLDFRHLIDSTSIKGGIGQFLHDPIPHILINCFRLRQLTDNR